MRNRRATYTLVAFLGAIQALAAASDATAACPTEPDYINSNKTITVPMDCSYMNVKMWGGGGNAGLYGAMRGRGGGGGYVEATFAVSPGQQFHTRVAPAFPTETYPGRAVALHRGTNVQGKLVLVAAGGGGGGSSVDNLPGSLPDGGAGGAVGEDGGEAQVMNPGRVEIGGGVGGTTSAGGAGGVGENGNDGYPGEYYPCDTYAFGCGFGVRTAGHGGLGAFGGGGGGSDD